jgi:hypothetical protein
MDGGAGGAAAPRPRPQLPVVRQAALGHRELAAGRTDLLLDVVMLDAADALGGIEDAHPRRIAFAEGHRITPIVAGPPVLAVHAADAARVRFDPGHGISPGLHARADIELQYELARCAGGQDVHRSLAVDRPPLDGVVVESGRHAVRPQRLCRRRARLGQLFPGVDGLELRRRAGHDDHAAAQDGVELDRVLEHVAAEGRRRVVRRRTAQAEVVELPSHVPGHHRRPLQVGRIELDQLVAHLRDARERAGQIIGQLGADRVQLQPDRHARLPGRLQRSRRERQHAGRGEKPPARHLTVLPHPFPPLRGVPGAPGPRRS